MLLLNVGFDPRPHWSWRSGRYAMAPDAASSRIDEWLRVRHTIAHGAPLPPVSVIARTGSGTPTLTRDNAERCMTFFERLVAATTASAGDEFP